MEPTKDEGKSAAFGRGFHSVMTMKENLPSRSFLRAQWVHKSLAEKSNDSSMDRLDGRTDGGAGWESGGFANNSVLSKTEELSGDHDLACYSSKLSFLFLVFDSLTSRWTSDTMYHPENRKALLGDSP